MSNPRSSEPVENRSRGNHDSPVHLYIVVDCKTEGCTAAHVLTYLGEKGKTAETVEYWMSYPLMIGCAICGKEYDYADSEGTFRQKELPAPPIGHLDRLARPNLCVGDQNEA